MSETLTRAAALLRQHATDLREAHTVPPDHEEWRKDALRQEAEYAELMSVVAELGELERASETSTSDTTRLEWLFSKLNDAEIKRKVQAVSDVHMEGAVHGIRLADWRHAIDVARIQFVEKP